MQIAEGEAYITVENRTIHVQAGDEPIFIPRHHVHGLTCLPGVKMTMREWTTTVGRFKVDLVRSRDSSGSVRLGTAKIQVQVPRSWSRDSIPGFLELNLAGSNLRFHKQCKHRKSRDMHILCRFGLYFCVTRLQFRQRGQRLRANNSSKMR